MRNCFKQLLLLALFAGIFAISRAQDFLPVLDDNFMGINQAFLQPAAIADSRFKTDFNVGGFNNDITNDAMHFRSKWIMNPTEIVFNDNWWDENTYLRSANGKDKHVFMSQSLLGPGFLATIDKKNKYAIGFTSRVRSITNADGIGEPLFNLIYSNYSNTRYFNKWYHDKDMRAVQHIFGDYGLTFAGVIFDKGEHFLKAGGTLKLLQGIAASYMQTDNLYYYYNGEQYPGAKPLSWNSSYVYGGLSDNWGFYDEQGVYNFAVNYQLTAKPSVGLDLGVVYEFRPKYKDFYYTSGKDTLPRNDKNKYFVKVGISLLDIGRLKYEKRYNSSDMLVALTPDYLNRYNSVDNSVPVNTNWMDGNNINFSFWNYVNFADTMYHRAVNGQGVQFAAENKEKFTVKLPAAISLQVDLYLLKGLYVNITTYTALNQGYSTKPNSHYVSNYSITPRYERKWYSVSVPVIINQYKKLDVGLGVRAGAVYFGVNNLFSNVFSDPYGMHWYVGLKVPIPYKDPTKQPKPPKLPKQKPQPQIIICCPCSGYTQPDSLCRKCFQQIFRDTNNLKKMDCIPCGVQIIINNPTINIGTTNVSEQKNEIKKDSVITPPQPPTPPLPAIPCIQFEFDKSDLITSEIPYLVDLAKILNDNPSYELTIYGHTDSFGTDSYNMGLSKKRAEAARAYLLNKGVRNRIKIIPCGESQPVAGNTTDSGRQMNRRVCFDLIKSGASSINSIQGTHTKIIAVHHLTRKQIPTFNTTDVSPSSVQTYAFIPPTSGLIQPVKHKKRNSKFKI